MMNTYVNVEFRDIKEDQLQRAKLHKKMMSLMQLPGLDDFPTLPQDIKAVTICYVEIVNTNEEDVQISHADVVGYSYCSKEDNFDSLYGRIQSLQRAIDLFKAQGRTLDPKLKNMLKSMKDGIKKRK